MVTLERSIEGERVLKLFSRFQRIGDTGKALKISVGRGSYTRG